MTRDYLKTVATPKHFAVHSGPESTRHTVDVHASRHDMEDTYLPAFRATVMEARAQSVMCAYNSLNGQPACANTDLLQQHLRDDWGFQGYVVSDCGAVADVFIGHQFAATPEQGVTAVFQAGTDLICGDYRRNMTTEPEPIVNAVRSGMLPQAVIDRALQRLFGARFRLGLFDPPASVPYATLSAADNDTEAHRQLALRVARESIVLLKNRDHLLPLKAARSRSRSSVRMPIVLMRCWVTTMARRRGRSTCWRESGSAFQARASATWKAPAWSARQQRPDRTLARRWTLRELQISWSWCSACPPTSKAKRCRSMPPGSPAAIAPPSTCRPRSSSCWSASTRWESPRCWY
jgi:beta-glucosidase-like glycosyl hydrolase